MYILPTMVLGMPQERQTMQSDHSLTVSAVSILLLLILLVFNLHEMNLQASACWQLTYKCIGERISNLASNLSGSSIALSFRLGVL